MNIIDQITADYIRDDIPAFGVGDTVKVYIKIKEGSRERVQIFEGYILKIQGGGISKTFTVRRIASGVGVEKTFPFNSPKIEKIEVVKRGKVRRAKINYMRQRTGKSAKIKVAPEKIRAPKAEIIDEIEEEIIEAPVVEEVVEAQVEAPVAAAEAEAPATEEAAE